MNSFPLFLLNESNPNHFVFVSPHKLLPPFKYLYRISLKINTLFNINVWKKSTQPRILIFHFTEKLLGKSIWFLDSPQLNVKQWKIIWFKLEINQKSLFGSNWKNLVVLLFMGKFRQHAIRLCTNSKYLLRQKSSNYKYAVHTLRLTSWVFAKNAECFDLCF